VEEGVRKMSEKALAMLKHMRKQIFGQPARNVEVRGAAVSIGVDPIGSECEDLVDELLWARIHPTLPQPEPHRARAVPNHGFGHIRSRGRSPRSSW
jgi:hypothetical protein